MALTTHTVPAHFIPDGLADVEADGNTLLVKDPNGSQWSVVTDAKSTYYDGRTFAPYGASEWIVVTTGDSGRLAFDPFQQVTVAAVTAAESPQQHNRE